VVGDQDGARSGAQSCIGTFHGSWLQARVSLKLANAGCTKHIFGVCQGAANGVSTAARTDQGAVNGSSSRPRNSAVPRRRQCGDSKLRAHLSPPTDPVAGAGDAVADVLVMARLDAQAAVAQNPPVRHVESIRATVRGPTKANGVGHTDAWRVAGSAVTVGCHHGTAQSVVALSRRLVGVRPFRTPLALRERGRG
jgi:hypothetical protein